MELEFGVDFLDEVGDNNPFSHAIGVIQLSSLQNFLLGTVPKGSIAEGNAASITREPRLQASFRTTGVRLQELPLTLVCATSTTHLRRNATTTLVTSTRMSTQLRLRPWDRRGDRSLLCITAIIRISDRALAWHGMSQVMGRPWCAPQPTSCTPRNPSGWSSILIPSERMSPALVTNTGGTAINAHTPGRFNLSTSQFNWNLAGPVFPILASLTTTGAFAGTYTGCHALTLVNRVCLSAMSLPPAPSLLRMTPISRHLAPMSGTLTFSGSCCPAFS